MGNISSFNMEQSKDFKEILIKWANLKKHFGKA